MTEKKVVSKAKTHPASKPVKSSVKPKIGSDKKIIPSKKVVLSKSNKPLVSESKKIAPALKKAVVPTKAAPKSPATKQPPPSSKKTKDPQHSIQTVKPAKTEVKKTETKAVASKTPSYKTTAKPVVKATAKGPVKASKKVIKTDEKPTKTKVTSTETTPSTAKVPVSVAKKTSVAVPQVMAPPSKPKAPKAPGASSKSSKKDTKHFTPEELNVFYVTMLNLRERLSAQVSELREQSLLRHDEVNQDEDGTDAFERVTSLDRASNDQSQINQINNAILTITEGTYGLCESCGEKIERPRLNALPFAEMCIKCQSELEGDTHRRKPSTDLLD